MPLKTDRRFLDTDQLRRELTRIRHNATHATHYARILHHLRCNKNHPLAAFADTLLSSTGLLAPSFLIVGVNSLAKAALALTYTITPAITAATSSLAIHAYRALALQEEDLTMIAKAKDDRDRNKLTRIALLNDLTDDDRRELTHIILKQAHGLSTYCEKDHDLYANTTHTLARRIAFDARAPDTIPTLERALSGEHKDRREKEIIAINKHADRILYATKITYVLDLFPNESRDALLKHYLNKSYLPIDTIKNFLQQGTTTLAPDDPLQARIDKLTKADPDDHHLNNIARQYKSHYFRFFNAIRNQDVRNAAFDQYLRQTYITDVAAIAIADTIDQPNTRHLAPLAISAGTDTETLHDLAKGIEEPWIPHYKKALENNWHKRNHLRDLRHALTAYTDDATRRAILSAVDKVVPSSALSYAASNKQALTSTPAITEITRTVIDRAHRTTTEQNLNALVLLARHPHGGRLIDKLHALGKKKRVRTLRRIAPHIILNGTTDTSILKNALACDTIDDIIKRMDTAVLDHFGIDNFDTTLTPQDKAYLLLGYQHIKNLPNAKRIVAAALKGTPLEDYRASFGITTTLPYFTTTSQHHITIDKSWDDIAHDNYTEAIAHLQDTDMDVNIEPDSQRHATDLITTIEAMAPKDKTHLHIDALDHLRQMSKKGTSQRAEADSLTYRTGTLRDFISVGARPNNTCLNLTRMNAHCLISMVDQPGIRSFHATATAAGRELTICRSILHDAGDYLVVDDVYGNPAPLLDPLNNYAASLGKKLAIPTTMIHRLTDHDRTTLNGTTDNITYKPKGLIYTDSAGGRREEKITYKCIIPSPPQTTTASIPPCDQTTRP